MKLTNTSVPDWAYPEPIPAFLVVGTDEWKIAKAEGRKILEERHVKSVRTGRLK